MFIIPWTLTYKNKNASLANRWVSINNGLYHSLRLNNPILQYTVIVVEAGCQNSFRMRLVELAKREKAICSAWGKAG